MSNQNISISIQRCSAEGIDAIKRSQGLKQIFLRQGKIHDISIPILNNINLEFKQGERVAFLGRNGSGKSSILKLICGIYPPKTGHVYVSGSIASIIEMGLGIDTDFTGRQNIKLIMLYNNMLDKYSKEYEEKVIEFSELGDKIDLPVKTYSSGMVARLAFSTCVFQSPDILLLDEVFATGDGQFVEKSMQLMQNKVHNTPISIMVSHQESIIREHCNRCILMKNGSVVHDGAPEEILSIYNSGNY